MIRICPHSDSQCLNGMDCPFTCATDAYDGTKGRITVGVDMATMPDLSALAGLRAGEVRYVHTLPAGAVVTFMQGRALVVHPGGPPYWVDMVTGETETLELDLARPYHEDAEGRRWLLDGSGDVA